jgi:hypothetical protein
MWYDGKYNVYVSSDIWHVGKYTSPLISAILLNIRLFWYVWYIDNVFCNMWYVDKYKCSICDVLRPQYYSWWVYTLIFPCHLLNFHLVLNNYYMPCTIQNRKRKQNQTSIYNLIQRENQTNKSHIKREHKEHLKSYAKTESNKDLYLFY